MTTRLEVLNAMLGVNGETPVSSESSNNPAAIQASNLLNRVDKKVQARGWWFNKEVLTLSPNASGEIVLPQNTLSVDPIDVSSPYAQRGKRLYDRSNATYTINKSVKVDIVVRLDIDELPESAASYIQDKACKEYYSDEDGDAQKISDLAQRERESYAYLHREDLSNKNINIRNSTMGTRLHYATFKGRTRHFTGE